MSEIEPYNPLDKRHLGESVADALLKSEPERLGSHEKFNGAGIYAIYYTGDFPLYASMVEQNTNNKFAEPIYVGKAVPAGARKGGFGLDLNPGAALFNRLNDHAKSIRQAENIELDDFYCRFLVVDDIWIPLGESLLISKFAPLWNNWLEGFGNHDPGRGRYQQERSRWDVVHPGRDFALKCADRREPLAQIRADVEALLRNKYA